MKIDYATISRLLASALELLLDFLGYVTNMDRNKVDELIEIGGELVDTVAQAASELSQQ